MVASTPVYGFPFEVPGDRPGVSLSGGPTGDESDILAESVEAELERVDTAVADAQTRLDLLEAGTSMVGWVPVQSGNPGAVANFDVDLTDGGRFAAAEFELVRLHMRFQLDQLGSVRLRINAEGSGTSAYRTGSRGVDASDTDGIELLEHELVGSFVLGWGSTSSTNNLTCTLFHMNGNFFHNYQSVSTRQSSFATSHTWTEHWGSLVETLSAEPSTLRVFTGHGATAFSNVWFWCEGYRVPS
jgi:hypothetical protein